MDRLNGLTLVLYHQKTLLSVIKPMCPCNRYKMTDVNRSDIGIESTSSILSLFFDKTLKYKMIEINT